MIDLREANNGDLLISKHGTLLRYVGYDPQSPYPHLVLYPDGSRGTRLDNGQVFEKNRLPTDEDIIAVIPAELEDTVRANLKKRA